MAEEEPREYTSIEDWPAQDDGGLDLDLPSGAHVRLAPPPIVWLGVTGRLPARLLAIVKARTAKSQDLSDDEMRELLEWLIAASFVHPKVSTTKKPDCLHISRLTDRDKEAVAMALELQDYAKALKV